MIKNIFTIYQVQKSKLKLRREQNGGNKSNWKKFFDNNEEEEDEDEMVGSSGPAKDAKKEDEFANEIEAENRRNE